MEGYQLLEQKTTQRNLERITTNEKNKMDTKVHELCFSIFMKSRKYKQIYVTGRRPGMAKNLSGLGGRGETAGGQFTALITVTVSRHMHTPKLMKLDRNVYCLLDDNHII